ncbi:gliding motility-associated ABC transporter ATP-binding subunit GldA [Carboxylicivirga caseinilyticus]|uniref:gliding motility-associated ABC transporter ATP-binding subunit GldA n=1 Tax=Carboxylicivirga caseinilyticus TaxID=3417572 RepID=UPI003D329739|nr:gliding motility-associated ABC transporter ATP-binding subunit GldA [Marinilabiliaceae bacterium A049]
MSIVVKGIAKNFGQQKALDQVSFNIKSGEIVGFLGPNGAGKSTMMKIITGLLTQSVGSVEVCGLNNSNINKDYRRKIGYLPEHNPLYQDMYVKEYLQMVGGVYKLPNLKERVNEMIDLTGLEREQHKVIGSLSKGYRQRVGLAQALIHNPEVLILDEPTTGLDPNQILEIRNLITNIGKEKTVMLSTHIMQEVEAICERVIILNRGKIVADSPASQLDTLKGESEVIVDVEFNKECDLNKLLQLEGVQSVEKASSTHYKIKSNPKADIRPTVFQFAVDNQLIILGMSRKEMGLEELFHQLTQ